MAMLQESIEGAAWEWCQKKRQGIYHDLKWGSSHMWRSVGCYKHFERTWCLLFQGRIYYFWTGSV